MLAVVAPVLVLAAALVRPFVDDFSDTGHVAARVGSAPGRWTAATLLLTLGLASGALVVAAVAARTGRALPARAAVLGAVLVAYQAGANGLGAAAAARAGADVEAVMEEASLELVLLVAGMACLAVAWVTTARAASRGGLLTGPARAWAVPAAVVAALGFLVPSSWGELVLGAALAVLLVPLAAALGRAAPEAAPAASVTAP